MKKENKLVNKALYVGFGIILGMSMTAIASTLITGNVYLNDTLNISVNGKVHELKDATTGEREYPLTYKDRTYIPLRSVATLLGYNVDFIADSNTATVDSPDYVKPTFSSDKLTLNNISTSDIPLISKYRWTSDSSQIKGFVPTNTSATNAANIIYQSHDENSLKRVHPDSPFINDMSQLIKDLEKFDFKNRDANGGVYAYSYCDPAKAKVLMYALDNDNKCAGFVASYELDITYVDANSNKETKTTPLTTVFISNDEFYMNYLWVCDLIQ